MKTELQQHFAPPTRRRALQALAATAASTLVGVPPVRASAGAGWNAFNVRWKPEDDWQRTAFTMQWDVQSGQQP